MKRTSLLLLALVMLIAMPLMAQEWNAIVLKTVSFSSDGSGNIIIKLLSGATVKVPAKDVSRDWSSGVDAAIMKQKNERLATSSFEPPADAIASTVINSKCTDDWPDDFNMRNYCVEQQEKGLEQLRDRQMTGVLAKVRTKCAKDWPKDFNMRNYCEGQQIEALRKLSRK